MTRKPAFKSLWLVLPFVFFAIITFIRQEPLTIVLSIMGALISLGLLTVTYLGGRWMRYSLFDYFKKFFLAASATLSCCQYYSSGRGR